jgi:hypothetical protein
LEKQDAKDTQELFSKMKKVYLVEKTYQLAFSDAAIAKVHQTGFFLASN